MASWKHRRLANKGGRDYSLGFLMDLIACKRSYQLPLFQPSTIWNSEKLDPIPPKSPSRVLFAVFVAYREDPATSSFINVMFLLTVLGEILTAKKSQHDLLNSAVVLPMDAGHFLHRTADDSQCIMMMNKSVRGYWIL